MCEAAMDPAAAAPHSLWLNSPDALLQWARARNFSSLFRAFRGDEVL